MGWTAWRRLKAEKLASHGAGAVNGLLHVGEVGLTRGVLREVGAQQLRVAADHHQHVVEIVGESTSEMADRVKLLRVLELPLQLVPLGHVAAVEDDAADRFVATRSVQTTSRSRHSPAPLRTRVSSDRGPDAAGWKMADQIAGVFGRHEAMDIAARGDVGFLAEDSRGGGADVGDVPFAVDDQDDIGGVLDERAETRLLRQLCFEETPADAQLRELPEEEQRRHDRGGHRHQLHRVAAADQDLADEQQERAREEQIREDAAAERNRRLAHLVLRCIRTAAVEMPCRSHGGPAQHPGGEPKPVNGVARPIAIRVARVEVVGKQVRHAGGQQQCESGACFRVALACGAHRQHDEHQPIEERPGQGNRVGFGSRFSRGGTQHEIERQHEPGDDGEAEVCKEPGIDVLERAIGEDEVGRERQDVLNRLQRSPTSGPHCGYCRGGQTRPCH